MKFNWRANWEILLVLLIIVVGIVITTIAAIRNKDRQQNESSNDEQVALNNLLQHQQAASELDQNSRTVSLNVAANGYSDDGGGGGGGLGGITATLSPSEPQQVRQAGAKVARASSAGAPMQQQQQQQLGAPDLARIPQVQAGGHSARDNYEALGTEATPSAVLSQSGAPLRLSHLHMAGSGQRHQANRTSSLAMANGGDDSSMSGLQDGGGESAELLDDIHTTRSNHAGHSSNEPLAAGMEHALSGALSGPFANQQAQSLRHHQLEMDDLINSYSRGHSHARSNLTDAAIINDYANQNSGNQSASLLATILALQQQQRQQHQHQAMADEFGQQQSATGGYQRTYTPAPAHSYISSLLGDLLKLTRGHSHQSNGADLSASTVRPSPGILQQLRALPVPLLSSLFQGLNPTANGNGAEQVDSFPNHDVSESSQHYQRIMMSPSDLQSLISRSQRSSILPAFPAPKGAPQNWIAPNSGGDPSLQQVHNLQAEFVANNAAGFLHQSQSAAGPRIALAPSDQYQQQQPHQNFQQSVSAENGFYQAPVTGSAGQSTATSNGQEQSQSTSSFINKAQEQFDQPGQIYVMPRNNKPMDNSQQQTMYRPQQVPMEQASQLNQPQQQQRIVQTSNQNHNFNHAHSQSASGNHRNQMSTSNGVLSNQQVGLKQPIQQRLDISTTMAESRPRPVIVVGAKTNKLISQTTTRRRRRRRRSVTSSSKYAAEEDEEADCAPLSVVRPDGQPIESSELHSLGRDAIASEQQQVSQSQRSPNHLELDTSHPDSLPHSLEDDQQQQQHNEYVPPLRSDPVGVKQLKTSKSKDSSRRRQKQPLATAQSGLMSRLLGVAASSNSDDLGEDGELNADDDDNESASERRKEALEDAEFGINSAAAAAYKAANKAKQQHHQQQQQQLEAARMAKKASQKPEKRLSTESQANRRQQQQQRSDIEFYGHPGEETRQLKYGILGSGNYEVVNGGIYPEANDESTAAVNSVANYVRKPGALLSSLPKLLAGGAAGSGLHQQSTFMPGDRLSGAFMRGASANPNDLADLSSVDKELAARPLLELFEAHGAAGQLFDANLLAHLGGGSSAATSTQSHHLGGQDEDSNDEQQSGPASRKTLGRHPGKEAKLERQPSSIISSSRSRGVNQFNSYQILPSKKVTIFSDQDLDSAPSDINFIPKMQTPGGLAPNDFRTTTTEMSDGKLRADTFDWSQREGSLS